MQRRAELRDGTPVVIRAIEPEDAHGLVEGFEGLSDRTRYERFLTATPRLPRHWVDQLVDLDHRDREALVAVDPQSGTGVGVARYVRLEDDPDVAEFAITVTDAWQGRGAGLLLLEELMAAARANGLRRLSGEVLAGNRRMLGLTRRLGGTIGLPRRGVVHVVIGL